MAQSPAASNRCTRGRQSLRPAVRSKCDDVSISATCSDSHGSPFSQIRKPSLAKTRSRKVREEERKGRVFRTEAQRTQRKAIPSGVHLLISLCSLCLCAKPVFLLCDPLRLRVLARNAFLL